MSFILNWLMTHVWMAKVSILSPSIVHKVESKLFELNFKSACSSCSRPLHGERLIMENAAQWLRPPLVRRTQCHHSCFQPIERGHHVLHVLWSRRRVHPFHKFVNVLRSERNCCSYRVQTFCTVVNFLSPMPLTREMIFPQTKEVLLPHIHDGDNLSYRKFLGFPRLSC